MENYLHSVTMLRLLTLILLLPLRAVPDDQPPLLQVDESPNMYARPGQNVTLQCRFNTDPSMELPMLTIRWSKDGLTKWFYNRTSSQDDQEDELMKGKADLYLGQVQEEDSGTYTCTIKYRTLEKSIQTVVTVRGGALPPSTMQHPFQRIRSEDPASANVTADKYRTMKIALVCGVVASTFFFVFIIFFFIP